MDPIGIDCYVRVNNDNSSATIPWRVRDNDSSVDVWSDDLGLRQAQLQLLSIMETYAVLVCSQGVEIVAVLFISVHAPRRERRRLATTGRHRRTLLTRSGGSRSARRCASFAASFAYRLLGGCSAENVSHQRLPVLAVLGA